MSVFENPQRGVAGDPFMNTIISCLFTNFLRRSSRGSTSAICFFTVTGVVSVATTLILSAVFEICQLVHADMRFTGRSMRLPISQDYEVNGFLT